MRSLALLVCLLPLSAAFSLAPASRSVVSRPAAARVARPANMLLDGTHIAAAADLHLSNVVDHSTTQLVADSADLLDSYKELSVGAQASAITRVDPRSQLAPAPASEVTPAL